MEPVLKKASICPAESDGVDYSLRQKRPKLSREWRMAPCGSSRGRICGSRERCRHAILKLRINETNNRLLKRDVGNTQDDHYGGENDDVGSGAQNNGHSTGLNISIHSV